MYKVQHKAGYFSNSILELFISNVEKQKIEDIINYLCHFSLETSESIEHENSLYSPEIKIISNIISRGYPSPASLYVEDVLAATLGYNSKHINPKGKISYPFNDEELSFELRKALHIIDPRITKENQTEQISDLDWKDNSKSLHLNFKYSFVPEYLGKAFIQLVDNARNYSSFVESSNYKGSQRHLQKKYGKILANKCDFALEMPYEYQESKGIIVELDDTPTNTSYDYEIEQIKKGFCNEIKFSAPLIIDCQDNERRSETMKPLINFTYNEYFDIIAKNYRSPLYNSDLGLDAMQYALSPLAVGRIQKVVIEYLLAGKLNLLDQKWNIAVIERDIPCAHLAFQDLKLHFENLFALKGDKFKFPEVNLSIYATPEFSRAKLNEVYTSKVELLENFDKNAEYDLLIDISMLQRIGILNEEYVTGAKNIAVIKSVRQVTNSNKVLTDKQISYADILSGKTTSSVKNEAKKALKFFLNNIFRQDHFTELQLELANKILLRKNVLGMFPTSTERNTGYQLAAMFQAGINIIISPSMWVMLERVETLKKHNINNAVILNKAVKDDQELNTILQDIVNGKYQFIFMQPDFLHYPTFRDIAKKLYDNKVYISQFVIDVAHCISEFSNDFNTMYNDLGKIKKLLFKNVNNQNIPNTALSPIDSYTSIYNIQKAFNIALEDIVKLTNNKTLINFKTIDTSSEQLRSYMDMETINRVVGSKKQLEVKFLIKELFSHPKSKGRTLIYSHDAYGKMGIVDQLNESMADKVANSLDNNVSVGRFLGTTDDYCDDVPIHDARKSEQDFVKFINNKLDVLISAKTFGTGVNAGNISNIIFFSPPFCIDNLIQQIYGKSENQKPVNCYLPIDNKQFVIPDNDPILKYISTNECSYDKYIGYQSVMSKYQGKDKELRIIKELLYNITQSVSNYKDIINEELKRDYKVNTELELVPADNPSKLYINEEDKTHGYVDLVKLDIFSDESNFNKQISKEILNFVAIEIEKRKHINSKYALLLQQKVDKQISKGIIPDTKQLKADEIIELTIPYESNAINEITALLNKAYKNIFDASLVKNLYKQTNSVDSFLRQISKVKKISRKRKLKDEVSKLYFSIRLKEDTALAIYRLTQLGIIQDFIIDDLNNVYLVRIKKYDKTTILSKLSNIFEDYLLNTKLDEYKKKLSKIGNNFIDESIIIYLDFYYEAIVRERIKSVDNMYNILYELSKKDIIDDDINTKLNNYLNNYFTNRYSNPFIASEQSNFLNSGNKTVENIQKYFDSIGGLKENCLQIMHSAKTMSADDANNYIAILISAQANLLLGSDIDSNIDSALEQAAQGFIKMRKQKDFDISNYANEVQMFLRGLNNIKPNFMELYEELLWLKIHRIWLSKYNNTLVN